MAISFDRSQTRHPIFASDNLLLRGLGASREKFMFCLQRVPLEIQHVLETPGEAIDDVFFVESGIVSIVATTPSQRTIEIGMLGYEGMTGMSVFHGVDRAPNMLIVRAPGWALKMSRADFESFGDVAPLRALWSRYAHVQHVQTSQAALANGVGVLVERIACSILMWNDRLRLPVFRVTHDGIAQRLGVRRSGVTNALHILEGDKLIRSDRKRLTVLDRDGLIAAANGFYGSSEATYDRVMGAPIDDVPARPPGFGGFPTRDRPQHVEARADSVPEPAASGLLLP